MIDCSKCFKKWKQSPTQVKFNCKRCNACSYRLYYKKNHRYRIKEGLLKKPWLKHLHALRDRCNNPNTIGYKWYGAKGIAALLTINDIKFLWFRDKAYDLDRPSIDRINPKKDYVINNCRFIEALQNTVGVAKCR